MKIVLSFFVLVAMVATPAMAAWSDNFDSYNNGQLIGQGAWYSNWTTCAVTPDEVAGKKVAINAVAGTLYLCHAAVVSANVYELTLQVQKDADATTSANIGDMYFELANGAWVGWRFNNTQIRGRWFDGGTTEQNRSSAFHNIVGNDTAGTWDSVKYVLDTSSGTCTSYITPAGGAEVQHYTWTSTALQSQMDTFRVRANATSTPGTVLYMDNINVTPEPATLGLLLLGLPFMRRRR